MRIGKIRLVNFTTHQDTTLEFVPGINIITGSNGSGKSSVVQALYFALFGRGLYYGRKDELVRHGSRNLLVELHLDGDRLRVIRRSLRGVETEGVNITSSNQLKEYLFRFFNISPRRLVNTLLIKQGETTSFVDRSPSERLKLYESIVGVDTLRAIMDALSALSRRYADFIRDMNLEALEEEIRTLNEEMESLGKDIEDARKKSQSLKEKLGKLDEEIGTLEKRLRKREALEKELVRLKSAMERVGKVREELKGLDEFLQANRERYEEYRRWEARRDEALRKKQLKEEVARLERELSGMDELEKAARLYGEYLRMLENPDFRKIEVVRKRVVELMDAVGRHLEIEEKKMETFIAIADERLSSLIERLEKIEEEKERLISERGKALSLIEEKKKVMETLRGTREGKCPVCGAPLTPEHVARLMERYSREMENLRRRVGEIEARLKKLAEEERRLERGIAVRDALEELKSHNRWIEERRGLIEEWKRVREYRNLEEKYRHYERMKEKRAQYEQKKKTLHSMGDLNCEEVLKYVKEHRPFYEKYTHALRLREKYLKELEELNPQEILRRMDEVKGILSSIDIEAVEEKLKSLRRERDSILAELGRLEASVKEKKALLEEKARRKKDIEEQISRAKSYYRRKEFYSSARDRVALLIDQLKSFHDRNLQILTWNHFRDFELEAYNGIHFETDSSGMNIYATTHQGNRVYVQNMSGGERVALNLAIRMAMARLLDIKFRTIIMDEPTAGLDARRVEKLGEILQSFVKMNPDSQIILITHEEKLADYAHRRFRFQRRGNATVVEEF